MKLSSQRRSPTQSVFGRRITGGRGGRPQQPGLANVLTRAIVVVLGLIVLLPWMILYQIALSSGSSRTLHSWNRSDGSQPPSATAAVQSSSKSKASNLVDASYDGPPADLVVHGKREFYTPVPPQYLWQFEIQGKGAEAVTRAFRHDGWQLSKHKNESHFVYRSKGAQEYYHILEPWQRLSRIPGFRSIDSKDGFLLGFRNYYQRLQEQKPPPVDLPDFHSMFYFLPATYRMEDENDVKAFNKTLETPRDRNRPWVKKNVNVNNGEGIEMLGPNSESLMTAVDRSLRDSRHTYIIQEYICNELTWFHGEKFDLRFYFTVVSVDPPIVMLHDGYVRVGGAAYNESDWSTTDQHLTNHAFRVEDQSQVTANYLWQRVREHYEANKERLAPRLKNTAARGDPVRHVRNQMKEALGSIVAANLDQTFGGYVDPEIKMENFFGYYGTDFIIDADLDVYFIEVQSSPGFGESYDYRVDMYRELFRPFLEIVRRVNRQQERNATENLLPLLVPSPESQLGGWDLVYAGDWQYKYKGYKRDWTQKLGCQL